jgi:hypothetical protein
MGMLRIKRTLHNVCRVRFSYVGNVAELISIAPSKNVLPQRGVSGLLDDVRGWLVACHRCHRNLIGSFAPEPDLEVSSAAPISSPPNPRPSLPAIDVIS